MYNQNQSKKTGVHGPGPPKREKGNISSLAEGRGHRPRSTGEGIGSLDAPHATDDAPGCRERRELGAAEVAHVVAYGGEPTEGHGAELRGVLERVDGLVRQPSLDAHVDQALELVLLCWWRFRVEEVQHLLGVGVVLDLHVPFDGSPDAVDSMLGLDGQGSKVPR